MIDLRFGNITDVLPTLEADAFDGCLCDPPYELGFMGKHWDASGITYNIELWQQVYRVLKPGAYLLAFGGTRTSHRLACAIEDAGFEIRDTIDWVYGSGFPKSLDVSKAIDKAAGAEREVIGQQDYSAPDIRGASYDQSHVSERERLGVSITVPATDSARTWQGYGTALKPAHEPIIVARKPLSEATVAANCQKWGTGALNIDAGRVEAGQEYQEAGFGPRYGETSMPNMGSHQTRPWVQNAIEQGRPVKDSQPHSQGRFPANLITDGSAEVVAMFPQSEVSGSAKNGKPAPGEYPGGFGGYAGKHQGPLHNDSGSAARFFKACPLDDDDYLPLYYCAKASKAERDAGLDGFDGRRGSDDYRPNDDGQNGIQSRLHGATIKGHNGHPTVKPISLTRYLATLILPPAEYAPRKMLVPFAGVASEMIGAMLAGWDEIIGIEREAEYCEIGRARLEYWQAQLQLALPMVTA